MRQWRWDNKYYSSEIYKRSVVREGFSFVAVLWCAQKDHRTEHNQTGRQRHHIIQVKCLLLRSLMLIADTGNTKSHCLLWRSRRQRQRHRRPNARLITVQIDQRPGEHRNTDTTQQGPPQSRHLLSSNRTHALHQFRQSIHSTGHSAVQLELLKSCLCVRINYFIGRKKLLYRFCVYIS